MKKGLKYLLFFVMCVFLMSACCKKQALKKDQTVAKPPVKQAKQEPAPPAKPAPVQKEQPAMKMEKPKMVAMPMIHKVVKGECLWIISSYKEIYNDPFMWPLIYKYNKEKIKDPDLIFPGQVLDINRDYSYADEKNAVHFAKTRGKWSLWDGK
jgi:hypothetical protein